MATTPKPGDWVGLAMHHKVPGVDRSTSRGEAKTRLLAHLVEGLLAERGLPPGMTEDEIMAYQFQYAASSVQITPDASLPDWWLRRP